MSDERATDVLIVGGGVIGLAVGWRALREGLTVRLLEREPATAARTTHVAAGMIAPVSEASPSEPALLALGLESAARYPDFVAELEAATGLSTGYRRCGSLAVARDADEAAVLERELSFRQTLGSGSGSVSGSGLGLGVRRLLPSEARRLEPALAPTLRLALDIPDDHAIDPRALSLALAAAFTRAGGELVTGAAVAALTLNRSDDEVSGARLDDGRCFAAEHVVIAAGPWSGQVDGIPDDAQLPLRPVKGQILTLVDPDGPGMIERVLRMQPGYLVPRGDGRYVLGASVEERGFDTTITVGAVHELLRDVVELVPGASDWTLSELNAGSRPGTADNLPVIGPSPALAGLHWATGHHRHGIMLTPLTAETVVAHITGVPAPEAAAAAGPGRFTLTPGALEVTR